MLHNLPSGNTDCTYHRTCPRPLSLLPSTSSPSPSAFRSFLSANSAQDLRASGNNSSRAVHFTTAICFVRAPTFPSLSTWNGRRVMLYYGSRGSDSLGSFSVLLRRQKRRDAASVLLFCSGTIPRFATISTVARSICSAVRSPSVPSLTLPLFGVPPIQIAVLHAFPPSTPLRHSAQLSSATLLPKTFLCVLSLSFTLTPSPSPDLHSLITQQSPKERCPFLGPLAFGNCNITKFPSALCTGICASSVFPYAFLPAYAEICMPTLSVSFASIRSPRPSVPLGATS